MRAEQTKRTSRGMDFRESECFFRNAGDEERQERRSGERAAIAFGLSAAIGQRGRQASWQVCGR
jgi:hypothetical protein